MLEPARGRTTSGVMRDGRAARPARGRTPTCAPSKWPRHLGLAGWEAGHLRQQKYAGHAHPPTCFRKIGSYAGHTCLSTDLLPEIGSSEGHAYPSTDLLPAIGSSEGACLILSAVSVVLHRFPCIPGVAQRGETISTTTVVMSSFFIFDVLRAAVVETAARVARLAASARSHSRSTRSASRLRAHCVGRTASRARGLACAARPSRGCATTGVMRDGRAASREVARGRRRLLAPT